MTNRNKFLREARDALDGKVQSAPLFTSGTLTLTLTLTASIAICAEGRRATFGTLDRKHGFHRSSTFIPQKVIERSHVHVLQ